MILFASSERYCSLQQWLARWTGDWDPNQQLSIINISGHILPAEIHALEFVQIEEFKPNKYIEKLWSQLCPHAEEWWKLLEINSKKSIELPFIPGLEDIAQLLYLAEISENQSESSTQLILLPHPSETIKLFQLAQNGPHLIDNLLEPLLNWWDKTRGSLSTVETLLRLKLPASKQLRLSDNWKSRLEIFQQKLSSGNHNPLIVFTDCESQPVSLIEEKIKVMGFYGAIPWHLILTDLDNKTTKLLSDKFCGGSLRHISNETDQVSNPNSILSAKTNFQAENSFQINEEEKTIKLYIPGIESSELQIQQIDQTLHLIYKTHHRTIDLGGSWSKQQCSRANIESGWLNLSFTPV